MSEKFEIRLPASDKNEKQIQKFREAWEAGKVITYKRKKYNVYHLGLHKVFGGKPADNYFIVGLVPVAKAKDD